MASPDAPAPDDAPGDLAPRYRRGFEVARRAAHQVLERRTRALRLAGAAYRKAARHDNALSQVREDLSTLARFVRAWARREYRSAPWTTLLYVVAALVYFVNPIDLIPDALAGIGLVDDVAIVAAVVHAVRGDLDRFRLWEQEHAIGEAASGDGAVARS